MYSSFRHLFVFIIVALTFGVSTVASAQMYIYEAPDGSRLMTTEPRDDSDYELLQMLEDPSDPSSEADPDQVESSSSSDSSSQLDYAPTTGSSQIPFSQREQAYDDIIREASEAYDVPFGFIKAVMRVESAFQSDAVSHAGAMGLMQLMPRTAESLNVDDPFDVRQNIFGGAKFLRILIDRYDGDINLILAAYNAGDVAVQRHDGIPYQQTRQYVVSVYHWYQNYSAEEDDS